MRHVLSPYPCGVKENTDGTPLTMYPSVGFACQARRHVNEERRFLLQVALRCWRHCRSFELLRKNATARRSFARACELSDFAGARSALGFAPIFSCFVCEFVIALLLLYFGSSVIVLTRRCHIELVFSALAAAQVARAPLIFCACDSPTGSLSIVFSKVFIHIVR